MVNAIATKLPTPRFSVGQRVQVAKVDPQDRYEAGQVHGLLYSPNHSFIEGWHYFIRFDTPSRFSDILPDQDLCPAD